jgi:tRNA pseudouridine38-40 synthase
MRRIMLTLEYDGTGFCGWQLQPDDRTGQAVLEEAMAQVTGARSRVHAASRTDSGVHAEGQVAHVDTDSALPAGRLLRALNYWLPDDISVIDAREVGEDFHARFGAASKLYRYRILRSRSPRPLRDRFAFRVWRELDVPAMQECAALLTGTHDFTSFASEHSEVENHERTVLRSELIEDGDELHYMVRADGFLYNMVRIAVGTLLEVGYGNMTVEEFAGALSARDRNAAGPTARARGLTLLAVEYPNDPRSAPLREPRDAE